jgi:hypothetical protein
MDALTDKEARKLARLARREKIRVRLRIGNLEIEFEPAEDVPVDERPTVVL